MKLHLSSEWPTGPLAVTDGNVGENSSRQQDTRDKRRDGEKLPFVISALALKPASLPNFRGTSACWRCARND